MVAAVETSIAMPAELATLFGALDPAAPLPARLEAVEELAHWALDAGGLASLRSPAPQQLARLQLLARVASANPDAGRALSATVGSIFRDTSAVALFADAGIPGDRGLASETVERIAGRVLPLPPEDESLERFVSRVFRKPRHCAWIAEAPLELLDALAALLGDVFRPIRNAMEDAVALLCTRVSALGLSAPLRTLSDETHVRDSPFFRLPHVPLEQVPTVIAECRHQLGVVHGKLESTGVSVDVVFRIDCIRRMLLRVQRMVPLLDTHHPASDRLTAARTLLGALTAGRIADRSLRQLARQNLGLLARKIIERVGHSGEHYVTSSRREYVAMLASAAGGGALTALTVIGKFFAKWAHFAPFMDGMLAAAVYAASFLAMQFTGLTLATKQPSMTAAALAGTIRETTGQHRLDELVKMIAKISRSQFAAAIGNVFTVIPVVILLDLLWILASGHHFLDEKTAATTIASFHPFKSGTIWYASLTGILLWGSSLGAGWLENWVTYRRLPDALRHHPVGRIVGRGRMQRIGDFVAEHAAGIGGNVTLGFLLGVTPVAGMIFGLPLDVRHVTLSTGSLTFAACSLGPGALTLAACIGIAVIGLLNFGVSFVLALAVALRARDVTGSERLGLAVAVGRYFVRHPLEFFVPVSRNGS
jgi:site-specific recombinase